MSAAIEPAERERLDVASLLLRRRDRAAWGASRSAPPEAARLDDFLARAPDTRLTTDLAAIAVHPGGNARHRRGASDPARRSPSRIVPRTTLAGRARCVASSRIADLRRIAGETRGELDRHGRARPRRGSRATESRRSPSRSSRRPLLRCAGVVLRQTIMRLLAEASEGARALSGGDPRPTWSTSAATRSATSLRPFVILHVTSERSGR